MKTKTKLVIVKNPKRKHLNTTQLIKDIKLCRDLQMNNTSGNAKNKIHKLLNDFECFLDMYAKEKIDDTIYNKEHVTLKLKKIK
jgi:hypothetical protein